MTDLISCCSWCVAEGTEAAPPMELRTDGICGRHLLEMKARILKDRALPRAAEASRVVGGYDGAGTSPSAAGAATFSSGATAPHSLDETSPREERT